MVGTLSRSRMYSISRPLHGKIGTAGHGAVALPLSTGRRCRVAERRRPRRVCATSSDPSVVSGSDLLGPQFDKAEKTEKTTTEAIAEALTAVPLNSERSLDFTKLKELLSEGKFQKADDESRALLLRLAGEEAQSRGWIYFTEVASIPSTDMKTIDELWKASSNGKFGYSVQKKIFARCMRRWTKFFKAIDWTVGENNNYRKWPMEFVYSLDAKPGHLPLTNCLRGTQLFEALMHHEAFGGKEDAEEASSSRMATEWTNL